MSRGFTLVEMITMILVLAVLSGFTFSVIWQYSNLYAEVRQGSIYSEASAALERISRELRDAKDVYTAPFVYPSYTAAFINFSLTHGTPSGTQTPPYGVQYCTCANAGTTSLSLYRVQNTTPNTANQCPAQCPPNGNVFTGPSGVASDTSLMSRNVVSSGFQIRYFRGTSTPEDDSYEIKLELAGDGSPSPEKASIRLVTRVSPRNYLSVSTGRSFNGDYYDEIR